MKDVTIIIPAWNNWELTKNCLKSIYETASNTISFEVICINCASFDKTLEGLRSLQYPNFKNIELEKNFGFATACNVGAKNAKGKYLFFLNNDTIVLKGSIEALCDLMLGNPYIGIAGCRLLYPDGTIQHAGMAADKDFFWHHIFQNYNGGHPLVNANRSFQAVTGAALIIETNLFHEVGGFDEQYLNSYEDIDLCFKVRKEKRIVVYEPNATFIHYESMSEGRRHQNNKNRLIFLEKWKDHILPDFDEMTLHFANKMYFLQCELETYESSAEYRKIILEQSLKVLKYERLEKYFSNSYDAFKNEIFLKFGFRFANFVHAFLAFFRWR